MVRLLILAVCAIDPVTEAGTAYRQALQALESHSYEQAVQLLRAALQRLGEESDALKYRDGVARQHHSYYPYYQWGLARELQAKEEPSIFTRRDLLKDALSRLSQTHHPEAAQRTLEVKAQLEIVEKAIELDASFASVKTRIEVLGTGERFEEALKQADEAARTFPAREKDLSELRTSLRERQGALIKRYEQVLADRLGDLARIDPVATSESIEALLRPALVPSAAAYDPGLPFGWLRKLMDSWGVTQDRVRKASDLPAEQVIELAGTFEATGLEALGAGAPLGFRAARHVAQAMRLAKLNRILKGLEDTIDTASAASVVKASRETAARATAALGRMPAGADATLDSLKNDVPGWQKQLEDLELQIVKAAKERARLTAPIVQAETALADGNTLGDPAALGKLRNDLFELESEANFGTLTAALRARALLAHALAEATLGFLEAEPAARVVDRCRVPAWRAFGFDPKVDARYAGRLSPKLQKILEQIKPQ